MDGIWNAASCRMSKVLSVTVGQDMICGRTVPAIEFTFLSAKVGQVPAR